tara:strand:- start:175 stop:390 length:216 start_codon:yes stop_codon:yes gene_type:complete
MLPAAILSAVFAGILGVISFSVLRGFIDGQDTSTWSAAERAIISDAVPVGIGLITFMLIMGIVMKARVATR